jgi:lipid II:glycine glycyltransferase (peptidoglycan interpeptide bridge formation enzyme)
MNSPDGWTRREIGPEWDTAWDALAGECPEAGFMQSSAWAAFKRAEGYMTPRLGLFAGEELRGGASLLHFPARDGGFLICPEGPVLPWTDVPAARAGLRLLTAAAEKLADQVHAVGLRIEPHLAPPRPSLLRNWSRAPVDLTPVHTLMLDVAQPDEAIRAAMHPKARYNLGLAQRHGVRVLESSDVADVARFYPLFEETALRNDFFAEPYGFFLNLRASLFPSRNAVLLLATWQDEVLAAILIVLFGRRATYLYGGSSSRHRDVMPSYALHWEAIQAARRAGCREYDFYGYDPFGVPDHQYAGISRFKRQWGAERRDSMGAHDNMFYDRLADLLAERLRAHAVGLAPEG